MSLDVYLTVKGSTRKPMGDGIFIRENGSTREITREEWDAKYPDREPFALIRDEDKTTNTVYDANITHNLNTMAEEAGIYKHLWRPEEIGISKASELIEPLSAGLNEMRTDPERFKALNPENGWGDYDGLCDFVERYLIACNNHPDADIRISR